MVGTIGKSGWARWLVVSCCVVMGAAACGSRLSKEEILAQNTVSGSRGAAGSQGTNDGEDDATASAEEAGGRGGSEARSRTEVGGAGGSARAGGKAPLIFGFIGWLSGIGGPTNGPARDALVAWGQMVNARGGINGHPVEILVGDDGGNESRTLSLMRDFVENRGAIAITLSSSTVVGSAKYAEEKRVPIIGVNASEPVWHESPMLFPPGGGIFARYGGSARLAKTAGVTKVAAVYCVEAATCRAAKDMFVKFAEEDGLQVVYAGEISFTQPDYTAECLQMSRAGAELVLPITENSSMVRLAQSCSRQDYRPIWEILRGDDSMAKIRDLEGAIAPEDTFPWFVRSGSPGVDEYVQALREYAPHLLTKGVDAQTWGWGTGKIFEKAAANVSDRPTSQDILNGLWAMKGETLGGLTPGPMARTFTQDQPTPDKRCVFEARIQGGKWVAPKGLTTFCR
jgi:branched-chain amino acid transport system substrate-binding protein